MPGLFLNNSTASSLKIIRYSKNTLKRTNAKTIKTLHYDVKHGCANKSFQKCNRLFAPLREKHNGRLSIYPPFLKGRRIGFGWRKMLSDYDSIGSD